MPPSDLYTERISVWEQHDDEDGESTWHLRETKGYVGTKDELQYFRMINSHGKHFFASPGAYLSFSRADIHDHESGLADIVEAWLVRHTGEGTAKR